MSNHTVLSLQVENIMRIKAASITPGKNLVVIGGKNGAGKTSLMKSVTMAMGGKDEIPPQPLRQGEEKGKIVVELEDLIVTRIFTAKGSKLKVTGKDGAIYSSPQRILDDLKGELTFDPLEFSRMDAKKQAETLRVLAGLDFGAADEARAEYYAERTAVNREGKAAAARLEAAPYHIDTPDEEVSIVALTDELEEAEKSNRENEAMRQVLDKTSDQIQIIDSEIQMLKGKMHELQEGIKLNDDLKKVQESRYDRQKKDVNALQDVGTASIKQRIRDAEGTNQKVRDNAARITLKREEARIAGASDALTKKINYIDADKRKALRDAKLPIDGLGLGVDGVTFGDLPFAQCSSAEQLRISVAMGMAMNPTLRILMIKDGSLLDEDSLAAVAKMAEDGDYQIWLERVGEGQECSVIMEDGTVKELEVPAGS